MIRSVLTCVVLIRSQDPALVAHAATNLSFIYFHEADYTNAIKYSDIAMKHNRYNAKALVNKGNCMFMRGEFDHARSMYQEAMGAEADCLEAIYNLGVVNKRLGEQASALGLFEKLHAIIPNYLAIPDNFVKGVRNILLCFKCNNLRPLALLDVRNADGLSQHLIAWNNKRSITRKLVLMVQRV